MKRIGPTEGDRQGGSNSTGESSANPMAEPIRKSSDALHRYLIAIHEGPRLFILRVPLKGLRWSTMLKAVTPIMHAQGARAKDLFSFEGHSEQTDSVYFEHLNRAFAGEVEIASGFDLWDWDGTKFILVREACQ